ncbi:MAG: hypothetical protein AB7L09_00150 [Nitrospira sp.]
MGTFGLGGLHRKSTWLFPLTTVAALPPVAVDGSVVLIKDTNLAFQYDAALPGWVPFPVGGGGVSTRTFNEVLAGTINGTNTVFTTAVDFIAGSEAVFFNGVRQHPGVGNDYTISESGGVGTGFDTITFAVAPRARPGAKPDDRVTVDYEPA